MTKLTNEIINSTNGLSSGTYVVEDTITLSHDLTIPEDVTLIFQGGKFKVAEDCTEEIEIKGFNTRLEAPICTIFGNGINVTGSWDIERAYPQWFDVGDKIDYTAYDVDNNPVTESFYDWSIPINKAINMKQLGEVFLKEGKYSIANPIHVNKGIQLVGENSQIMDNDCNGCTRIFPVAEGTEQFNHVYMVYINSYITNTNTEGEHQEHVIDNYLDQSTVIRNICFTDYINKEINQIHEQKCILAGGGVHLDRIVWYNFLQGIKYTDTYNDTKSITNCSFKYFKGKISDREEYAIDAVGLGDAFRFEHNAIHHTCNGKALKMSQCGGASIQGNIINSDILIEGCKAIVFNANHCESGMRMEIIDSSVTMNNNYFEKGTRENIKIHNSDMKDLSSNTSDRNVISMTNNMFLMYNIVRDKDKTDEGINYEDFKAQIKGTSEIDIEIDNNTILDITNTFRYEFITYFGKMYPFGIKIGGIIKSFNEDEDKYELTSIPFNEFNDFSYIASFKSRILPGFEVEMQKTIKNINAPKVLNSQVNNNIIWLEDKSVYNNEGEGNGIFNYKYYYQIIWDRTRNIKKTESSTSTSKSVELIEWYVEQSGLNSNGTESENENEEINECAPGVLLEMSKDVNGNCAMVRLIREKVNDNSNQLEHRFQDVYVPVCGSQFLYDNGISVCGYKWSDPFQFLLLETSDKNMEKLRIIDGNVECFTKREDGITPTSGWKRGRYNLQYKFNTIYNCCSQRYFVILGYYPI